MSALNRRDDFCNRVKAAMPDLNDQFVADICDNLIALDVAPWGEAGGFCDDDVWLVCFSVRKVRSYILNYINQAAIPPGLNTVAVDMVCGNYIQMKYSAGKLDSIDLDFEEDGLDHEPIARAVKTVTQGDTSVTFESVESNDSKTQRLIRALTEGKDGDLLRYRRMQW